MNSLTVRPLTLYFFTYFTNIRRSMDFNRTTKKWQDYAHMQICA